MLHFRVMAFTTLKFTGTIPHVLEDTPLINRQHIHFLHDGAPAHFSRTARRYLDRRFTDRWIARKSSPQYMFRNSSHSRHYRCYRTYRVGEFTTHLKNKTVSSQFTVRSPWLVLAHALKFTALRTQAFQIQFTTHRTQAFQTRFPALRTQAFQMQFPARRTQDPRFLRSVRPVFVYPSFKKKSEDVKSGERGDHNP
ncbi:hypothetical protein ANN_22194 [Periplaneta americana]|uniref:Uncharacterized protein n=1 Tax=Periplaneta americana TaxID=6978 RepID=A0ABQ8S8C7_PERAM|nr:hypothetical protein ANN_22194 [Periplaneta americana]